MLSVAYICTSIESDPFLRDSQISAARFAKLKRRKICFKLIFRTKNEGPSQLSGISL